MTLSINSNDWNSLLLNLSVGLFFFIWSVVAAIWIIPFFTIRKLQKKNHKYILRTTSFVIREICEFLNHMPFRDRELLKFQTAIFTHENKRTPYRFVGLLNIDIFNPMSMLQIQMVVINHFEALPANAGFEVLTMEKIRIQGFRENLERIIEVHSFHLSENSISEISELCLDILSFEIHFEYNHAMDDLIETGAIDRSGVFGTLDLARLYEKILILLKGLADTEHFESDKKLIVPSSQ